MFRFCSNYIFVVVVVVLRQVSVCSNLSGMGTPSSCPQSDGACQHRVSFTTNHTGRPSPARENKTPTAVHLKGTCSGSMHFHDSM